VNDAVQTALAIAVTAASLVGALVLPAVLARVGARDGRGGLALPVAVAVALAAWFAATSTIGATDGYRSRPSGFQTIGLSLLVPLAVGFGALWLWAPLRRALESARVQPTLVGIQAYRVIGGVFLLVAALGQLPWLFAVPAGVGDLLVGLTALGAASALRRGDMRAALGWNALGLLDLAVAIGIGVASAPGPLHLVTTTPSTLALTVPPLVIIPTFLVPLSIWLHVVSLRSLLSRGRVTRAEAPEAVALAA